MDTPEGARRCLFDPDALATVVETMAHQAASLLHSRARVAVVGILRRGAPLADRLTELLVTRHGLPRPLRLDLSVKRYADDLTLLYPDTRLDENTQHAAIDLNGYTLLVVDDVLYGGHSILRVIEYLAKKRPAEIRVAVLVDRCVARLPVHADVVGVKLQIAPTDIVECHVPPYEPDFGIHLLQPDRPR